MGKNKLARFAENKTFENLFQHTDYNVREDQFPLKGKWNQDYFHNAHPIVLELGCGKGEYTLGLAERYPDMNFIGIDRKGARLWRGCKTATENKTPNVAFIRAKIEDLRYFFAENEVSEIWVTFPDPQPKKARKRLFSPQFIAKYKNFLKPGGLVHLKTDSRLLYDFVQECAEAEKWEVVGNVEHVYETPCDPVLTEIQTFYEKRWIEEGSKISYFCIKVK